MNKRYVCGAGMIVASVAIGLVNIPAVQSKLAAPKIAPLASWKELKSPHYIAPTRQGGPIYYSFETDNGSRAHLIVINMKSREWQVQPAISDKLLQTSAIAVANHASAAINGGFFNLSDGVSASYVFLNGQKVADPTVNKALIENPKLKEHLPEIFNRTELRFLTDKNGRRSIAIANHNQPVAGGCTLLHSLQAGPRLLPTVKDKEEAFVRHDPEGKEVDAIGARKEAARTAFGITPDGYAMMLVVSGKGQDPESSGVTLNQLSSLLKSLGCSDAINLDGGASSSMYVRLSPVNTNVPADNPPGTVVSAKMPETRVKTVLLLLPTQK